MSNVIVLFEVKPTAQGMEKYLELGAMLKPMLTTTEGFVRAERFQSLIEEGKLLSMSVWENEQAIENWRNNLEHRMSQAEGKNKLFEYYKITVCSAVREYSGISRENAPDDSNEFLCNTHEGQS